MEPLRIIPDLLHNFSKRSSNSRAYAYWKNDKWEYLSSQEFIEYVQAAAVGLAAMGINKGDRIGIYAKSSPYWTIIDLAIAAAGGVTVPFFSNLSEEHFVYEVAESKPRFLFIGDEECWNSVSRHANLFEEVINLEKGENTGAKLDLFDVIRKGEKVLEKQPDAYEQLEKKLNPDDLATIIYTSGSTGTPKGAELTHKNLVTIVTFDEFGWKKEDRYFNVLPLAHIFAKQINYFMVAWGVESYFSNDLPKTGELCREIHPTFMIVVPRLLEKIYSKMLTKVQEAEGIKRAIGLWAFNIADQEGNLYKWLMHPLADKLVYSHLRDALGGKMRVILTGGAALNPQLHHFFLDVGIPIYQGWGLTEGSTVALNRFGKQKIGTVGPPLPDVEFKISSKGEVLMKSDTIMRGYYQNPEATAKAIDSEGWLHTGDLGSLDEDGFLIIEGRMSESFKTSQGEFVIPVPIEQKICQAPLIEMAMVIGEGQPFASALLFPDHNILKNLKIDQNTEEMSDEEFLQSDYMKKEIQNLLTEVNKDLNHWEEIHDYRFILETPTIEKGELTPTMKIRRKVLIEKYAPLIKDIYTQVPA